MPMAERTSGLDVCRSIAILLVLSGHLLAHSQPNPLLRQAGFLGLFGVDLFYCLSGFLIGRILLAESQSWHREPASGLLGFWFRRWMRTLPLYYFYLAVLLHLNWTRVNSLGAQLPYLFFCQNLAAPMPVYYGPSVWPMPIFYGLSWSLAVEEWFYLLFPLVLMLFLGLGASARRAALLAVAVFCIVPFGLRWYMPPHIAELGNFDEELRHVVIFRLDALGMGVLAAYLFIYERSRFNVLRRLWPLGVLLVALLASATKLRYPGFAGSRALAPVYFAVSALAFALLIPKFHGLPAFRHEFLNRFFRFTSLISYSLYLGHVLAFVAVFRLLQRFHLYDLVYPNPWMLYPLCLIAAYGLATVTYLAIERPMLRWREKVTRGAFHPLAGNEGAAGGIGVSP